MAEDQIPNGEDKPEFCSNKTCPISENKILRAAKVLKKVESVVLRKALFGRNDERWYCLKCLDAHDDSLFCYYCGQIYFNDEEDLEDDGKAWICCDDCHKWIHLDCDIVKGKNTELQKHFKDDHFYYKCPECKIPGGKKKRDIKAQQKQGKTKPRVEKNGNKRRCPDNNSSFGSNSVENASPPYKVNYDDDVKMAPGNSQMEDENVAESYMSPSETGKNVGSELDGDTYNQGTGGSRKGAHKKHKQIKKSRSKVELSRKFMRRSPDDYEPHSYYNSKETVEQFTRYRSLKIAKDREDIVESRSLGMKVSQF